MQNQSTKSTDPGFYESFQSLVEHQSSRIVIFCVCEQIQFVLGYTYESPVEYTDNNELFPLIWVVILFMCSMPISTQKKEIHVHRHTLSAT